MPTIVDLWRRLLADPVSGQTARRFALVLGFVALLSLVGSRDHLGLFLKLTAFNACLDAALAAALREPFFGPKLTRWDEALGFAALFLGARIVS